MKVVLVMFKDGERRDFAVAEGESVLGRRRDCTLRIGTPDVSRRHCELTVAGKLVKVRDLGSSNGTFVNGKRVAESPLRAGDKLSVGPVLFTVQIDGLPKAISPPPDEGKAAAAVASGQADDEILDLDDEDVEDDITGLFDDEQDEDKDEV